MTDPFDKFNRKKASNNSDSKNSANQPKSKEDSSQNIKQDRKVKSDSFNKFVRNKKEEENV